MPMKLYFRGFPRPYTFAAGNELRDGAALLRVLRRKTDGGRGDQGVKNEKTRLSGSLSNPRLWDYGSGGRDRTYDQLINSQLLYR